MSTTIYLLEPGATPPPPRPVTTSVRARMLLICGAVLFSVIFLGGVVAVVEAGQILYLAAAGQRITAHITHVDTSKSANETNRVGITYTFDRPLPGSMVPETQYGWSDQPNPSTTEHYDQAHPDQAQASQSAGHKDQAPPKPAASPAPLYKPGDRLVFRYAIIGGRIVMHEWSTAPYGMLFLLTAIGLTLMTVGALFVRRLYRWHRRRMRLLRDGIAVTGAVVSKRVDGLEGKYYLTYSYLRRTEPTVSEREEQCTPGQWRQFAEQDPVTVLYDPDRADMVGLYKLLADP